MNQKGRQQARPDGRGRTLKPNPPAVENSVDSRLHFAGEIVSFALVNSAALLIIGLSYLFS
jgi:hypothetical protein